MENDLNVFYIKNDLLSLAQLSPSLFVLIFHIFYLQYEGVPILIWCKGFRSETHINPCVGVSSVGTQI